MGWGLGGKGSLRGSYWRYFLVGRKTANAETKSGGRALKERTIGAGLYTEAGFTSFIKSALRRASSRWKPRTDVLKAARVEKGRYLCSMCEQVVPVTVVNDVGKRVKNVEVDHTVPVVDPEEGFVNWDTFIRRLFVEPEGFRVLCRECHSKVTQAQNDIAKARRAKAKEEGNE